MEPEEIANLSLDAARRFAMDEALYVRPMYFAEAGGFMGVPPDASSTRFCLTVFHVPMPDWEAGMRVGLTSFRRPTLETMPTNAKSGCLYPNNGRAILEVQKRGFQNALVLDMLGNVAELATSNIFMVKDGVCVTPAENGSFLAGITRHRVMDLLRKAGVRVEEASLKVSDFMDADEVFQTGKYSKVMPITKLEDREFQPGPVFNKARQAYWDYAHV